MKARPSPIRIGIPEGKIAWPVLVTASGVHVLGSGEVPRVKIHFGRLGRFVPRSALPPFSGTDAWFLMHISDGRFYVGDQTTQPDK
ncbi:hypothetical protein JIP62_10620 [Brevundimonas vitis]|uniref:Uncharacterized protein n=1 Tax=Brevundimonas vitisensis TaxID=2800818 RepID=A0ABX7BJP4_9CAUL|nr:hypothetical protein [Brevundimonas vitisensis]QQQ17786.1 hypothetical protein JIP62_10620 [Brevundimonas vitisensis]